MQPDISGLSAGSSPQCGPYNLPSSIPIFKQLFFPNNTKDLGRIVVICLAFYSILIGFIHRDDKYRTNILTTYFLYPRFKDSLNGFLLHNSLPRGKQCHGGTLPFNIRVIDRENQRMFSASLYVSACVQDFRYTVPHHFDNSPKHYNPCALELWGPIWQPLDTRDY